MAENRSRSLDHAKADPMAKIKSQYRISGVSRGRGLYHCDCRLPTCGIAVGDWRRWIGGLIYKGQDLITATSDMRYRIGGRGN